MFNENGMKMENNYDCKYLESRVKKLESHIEDLYKTIRAWEKLTQEKDVIIKNYENQVQMLVSK